MRRNAVEDLLSDEKLKEIATALVKGEDIDALYPIEMEKCCATLCDLLRYADHVVEAKENK